MLEFFKSKKSKGKGLEKLILVTSVIDEAIVDLKDAKEEMLLEQEEAYFKIEKLEKESSDREKEITRAEKIVKNLEKLFTKTID